MNSIYILKINKLQGIRIASSSDMNKTMKWFNQSAPWGVQLLYSGQFKNVTNRLNEIRFQYADQSLGNDWYNITKDEAYELVFGSNILRVKDEIDESSDLIGFEQKFVNNYMNDRNTKDEHISTFTQNVSEAIGYEIHSRTLMKIVSKVCIHNGWKLERYRNHYGRHFIIYK